MQWLPGDLFVSVFYLIYIYRKVAGVWTLQDEALNPQQPPASGYVTGSCFDEAGNFYVAIFSPAVSGPAPGYVVKFQRNFNPLVDTPTVISTDGYRAESVRVLHNGDILVGHAGDAPGSPNVSNAFNRIYRYTSAGVLITSYAVTVGERGSDWIDVAADGDTIWYTSEDSSTIAHSVYRYKMSAGQLASLPVNGVAGRVFGMAALSDGGYVIAGNTGQAQRYNSSGVRTHRYQNGTTGFAMALEGTTYLWTSGFGASSSLYTFAKFPLDGASIGVSAVDSFTDTLDPVYGLSVFPTIIPVTMTPTTLPAGTRPGVPYTTTTLTGAGGCGGPYTFAVTSGTLPGGITLTSGGIISGTPTTIQVATFTVTATDACSTTGAQAYSITITERTGRETPLPIFTDDQWTGLP